MQNAGIHYASCTKAACVSLPDVLVGHHEGLAERLGRVEPHAGVLLHSGRELSRDGRGAGVERTGDGREEGLIGAAWAHTCRGGADTTAPRH